MKLFRFQDIGTSGIQEIEQLSHRSRTNAAVIDGLSNDVEKLAFSERYSQLWIQLLCTI